jgi:hypothetical protein
MRVILKWRRSIWHWIAAVLPGWQVRERSPAQQVSNPLVVILQWRYLIRRVNSGPDRWDSEKTKRWRCHLTGVPGQTLRKYRDHSDLFLVKVAETPRAMCGSVVLPNGMGSVRAEWDGDVGH